MSARDEILAIPDKLLRQGQIAQAVLVHMDFKDNPKRWWSGIGPLTHAGHNWMGAGDIIKISDLEEQYSPVAQPLDFSLAATDEMVNATIDAEAQVLGRDVTVYGQLFAVSPDLGQQAWSPIGSPFAFFAGTMEKPSYNFQGLSKAGISLRCEGLFHRRSAPPYGLLTDADQKARHSGDKGCEYMAKYAAGYATRWV